MASPRKYIVALWVAYGLLALGLLYAALPVFETRFAPVYSKFRMTSAIVKEDGVEVVFEYWKHRDCDPKGLTWFKGEVGASTAMTVENKGGTAPRPVGHNVSNPYLFHGVTVNELTTVVLAQLRNQCYVPGTSVPLPWLTLSDVYP